MTELLSLPFSPWSEKARWALDVRRVPYTRKRYQPLLGEPALRWKLRRPTGRVTVPMLVTDDGEVLGDSADIARWADARGEGPRLFPEAHGAAIVRYIDLSERAMDAGRALTLRRMLGDDAALTEMVPPGIARALGRSAATAIGRFGVQRTLRKYGGDRLDEAAHRRTLADALDEIRAALARSRGGDAPPTLLGAFTFADIAVAQIMLSIEPPSMGLKLGEGSRRCFPDPELRSRYADLAAWRDALYVTFRAPTLKS